MLAPERTGPDIDEVPPGADGQLELVFVDDVAQVLEHALEPAAAPPAPAPAWDRVAARKKHKTKRTSG